MTKSSNNNDEILQISEVVMDAIVTQKLAPSQKVSENILSDMFGISRTVARNLTERLIAKHFFVSVSPRITLVAPLTLLEIKQNFTLRKILLPAVFSIVAGNLELDKLKGINEQIKKMQPIKDDAMALKLLKKNKELNLNLCEQSGYPLMLDWIHQLEDTAMRIYWLYLKTAKQQPYSITQHSMVLDILKSDEPARISSIIHDVLSQTEERILNTIFSHKQFYSQDLKV